MYCDQCGTEIRSISKFCPNCGVRLINETRISDNPSEKSFGIEALASQDEETTETNTDKDLLDEYLNQTDQSEEFVSSKYHPWRRFFARTVDLFSTALLVLVTFSFLVGLLFSKHMDSFIQVIENPIIAGIILYLIWIPVEAAFLAGTGTTPAKGIFGIRVLNKSGEKLSYQNALRRAFLVWVQGDGLSIPIVTLFTRIFAYQRLTKTGTTLWDMSVDSIVTHKQWRVMRAIVSTITVIAVLMIISILMAMGNTYG